jgi:hypothetical protein
MLVRREHDLARVWEESQQLEYKRLSELEICLQQLKMEEIRCCERASSAVSIAQTAKNRVAELWHENQNLQELLQANLDEVVSLQRCKQQTIRSQASAASQAERERVRMHTALVTVQTSHTSLLECNEGLRRTCHALQTELHTLLSKQDAHTTHTSGDTAMEGSSISQGRLDMIPVDVMGGGNVDMEALYAMNATLRREKRMLQVQIDDLQMKCDEMAAQVKLYVKRKR